MMAFLQKNYDEIIGKMVFIINLALVYYFPLQMLIFVIALLPLMFVFYLAVMNLKRNKDKLTPVTKPFAYLILWVGLALDIEFNSTWGTVSFLEIPKETLMTTRVIRHLHNGTHTWRDDVGYFWGYNFLDPFEPDKNGHVKMSSRDNYDILNEHYWSIQ